MLRRVSPRLPSQRTFSRPLAGLGESW
jgi:hypothetical protein